MGKIEEDPLLMLATVAIEEEEKENKKVPIMKAQQSASSATSCSFISERLMTSSFPSRLLVPVPESVLPRFSPTRKRSASIHIKKEDKNSSLDHAQKAQKAVKKLSRLLEETTFKNCFDNDNEECAVLKKHKLEEEIAEKGFKNKILDQTGLQKTQCSEKKVPRIFDNDFVPETKKRKYSNNGDYVNKRRKISDVLDGPNPPPQLPEEFKKKIFELAGGNIVSDENLVVQKKLENSDCKDGQNRFSIPKGNLSNQFLEDVEKVEKNQMVNIIDPSLKHYKIKLSNWKPFYALNGDSWKQIKLTNNLEPGMIMQLWGFRVNNKLWFALVNLRYPVENVGMEEAEKGSDHGGSTAAGGSSE